jgi:hypothetical protein
VTQKFEDLLDALYEEKDLPGNVLHIGQATREPA